MSAHFEVVRSDAPKQWHARYVVNGRIVWTTPQLSRQVGAERAILSLAREFGYEQPRLTWWSDRHREKALTAADPTRPWLRVVYLDERSTDLCSCGHPRSDHHSRVGCSVYTETNGFCGCVEGS